MNSAALVVIGTVLTALLILAVWWGIRRRAAEPAPGSGATPRRAAPAGEPPEADGTEFPDDGSRRTAHELKGYGNLGTPGTENEGHERQ